MCLQIKKLCYYDNCKNKVKGNFKMTMTKKEIFKKISLIKVDEIIKKVLTSLVKNDSDNIIETCYIFENEIIFYAPKNIIMNRIKRLINYHCSKISDTVRKEKILDFLDEITIEDDGETYCYLEWGFPEENHDENE